MIPMLPMDTSALEVPAFYRQIVDNLKIRSGHHEAWHTHKRDTSVCWICDLVEISNLCLNELERFISKSALDIEDSLIDQVLSSEDDRVNYNVNEENLEDGSQDSSVSVNDSSGCENSHDGGSESSS